MRRVELLAPAGSFEALQAAIQNGADAIYLGSVKFGARAFAQNFDHEQLREGVRLAHRYGVKIYVTMNTLIDEVDFEELKVEIDHLVDAQVDAIIIQDLGLLSYVRAAYPNLELHASTQMHIHNQQGFRFLKEQNIQRAVVARECDIEQIRSFAEEGIDLEVFVHGALCVAYSGQCLISSYLKGRSGNKGACAQHCRMKYDLFEDNKKIASDQYLLSTKDLNSIEQVEALIEAGIHSFKIEGRMKRPEYVAQVVSMYRKAIDAYYHKKNYRELKNDEEELKKIYNRQFTPGLLFNAQGSTLMNYHRPNHQGVEIGEVIKVNSQKMVIRLSGDLKQRDGIRIIQSQKDEGFTVNRLYKDGLLVNGAKAGDIIELDNKSYVEKGAKVVKTSDFEQLQALQKHYNGNWRKVKIKMELYLIVNSVVILNVSDDDGNYVSVSSDYIVEYSQKALELTKRIEEQVTKLGNTIYECGKLDVEASDNFYVPIKVINELRREACEQLDELRANREVVEKVNVVKANVEMTKTNKVIIVLDDLQTYEELKNSNVEFWVEDIDLYEQIKTDQKVKLSAKRITKRQYSANEYYVANEVGALALSTKAGDYGLNVTNSYSVGYLAKQGLELITLSKECSLAQSKLIAKDVPNANLASYVYDYPEVMAMEYCVVNTVLKDNGKKDCVLCKRERKYWLQDNQNERFLLKGDHDCTMHLFSDRLNNRLGEVDELLEVGISNFIVKFLDESAKEKHRVVNLLLSKIN